MLGPARSSIALDSGIANQESVVPRHAGRPLLLGTPLMVGPRSRSSNLLRQTYGERFLEIAKNTFLQENPDDKKSDLR